MTIVIIMRFLFVSLLFFLLPFAVNAQKYGLIKGRITDADSKESLLYATVLIKGTTHGTTSDAEGIYTLSNLLPGKYTIVYSFLGYHSVEKEVTISAGKTIILNVTLHGETIMGKEVIVTAQARGQASAINEQLKSNKIVNVVSRERIEEVPSQNAADVIGRLPGISVQRDGGEGQKVVIRGLSPKYSLITVNGARISPTDIENRSVDLSMISSDILSGIEVFKANTPDNDGDALGGTVNFSVKKADRGLHGKLDINTSYNNLSKEFGMYRGVLMLSNRFLNNKLGILALGTTQHAIRNSDGISASYNFEGERADGSVINSVDDLNLITKEDTRNRYGANLTADYQLNNGSILFNALYSLQQRHQIRLRNKYGVSNAYHDYDIRNSRQNTNMINASLNGIHHLQGFELMWRTAYSFTNNLLPYSHTARFREVGAYTGDLITDQGPELIPAGAKNDLNRTTWYKDYWDTSTVKDHNISGQLDIKKPFHFSDQLTGYLKFGAKIRSEKRKRDVGERHVLNDNIATMSPSEWERDRNDYVLMSNFIMYTDSSKLLGKDAYRFGPVLDNKELDAFANKNHMKYPVNKAKELEDYKTTEMVSSTYIMGQMNFTSMIMLLGGVRMEHTVTNYKSIYGTAIRRDDGTEDVSHIVDTTGENQYYTLLPMFQFKLKPLKWFDIRLAVTRGLSRPNYFDLVPWERYDGNNAVWEKGNPELKITTSWNYDAFLSFYGNFGLFTVGAFYKDIQNTIYNRKKRITNPESDFYGTYLISPVNDPTGSWVKGIEIELQTNFRYLPKPFSNITLYANYSHMKSLTHFPLLVTKYVYYDYPPYAELVFIDSTRDGHLPGQADDIANASVGYESKGFSARLSMTFQGNYTQFVGTRHEFDQIVQGFFRWDFNTYYKFKNNMTIYFNFNNITNTPEAQYEGSPTFPLEYYYYGWSIDLGFKYMF